MIWVLDTCALSEVRRIPRVNKSGEEEVLDKLSELVADDLIVYPSQVIDELAERGHNDEHFRPYYWSKEHKNKACRFGHLFDEVAKILQHPQIRRICEWDKSRGADPADPHILALAMHLR